MTTFAKAKLRKEEWVPFVGLHESYVNEVVDSAGYDRAIEDGYEVVETWNVWRCEVCGMYDSDRDRDHAAWEVDHFGPVTHFARYGHDSIRRLSDRLSEF